MNPENHAVEDVTARVAVITGATSGIGLAAAEEFARRGWRVALVGRDAARLAEATTRVREAAATSAGSTATGSTAASGTAVAAVRAFTCDFTELNQVRELADALASEYPHIDVLANNAGGAFPTRHTTVDGFELTIQLNHLAHFLLSLRLREQLRGGRIVNTASAAHLQGALDPDDLSSQNARYRMFRVYGSAKQANILFTTQAAHEWPDVISVAYHPGVVNTRFGNDSPIVSAFYRIGGRFLRTPSKGAQTLVWLATTNSNEIVSGGYYVDERLRRPAAKAINPQPALRLWRASLAAVGG